MTAKNVPEPVSVRFLVLSHTGPYKGARKCRWCSSISSTTPLKVELSWLKKMVLSLLKVIIVGPLWRVRPRRGKVVVLVVLRTVRSNSENCPNIHFPCFTDPHNHTYSESSRHVLSTDAPVTTMTKTHAKTKTKTELSRRRND